MIPTINCFFLLEFELVLEPWIHNVSCLSYEKWLCSTCVSQILAGILCPNFKPNTATPANSTIWPN